MDEKQMLENYPNNKYHGKGFPSDYKLVFTRKSIKSDGAVADILISLVDMVGGSIYAITEEDLNKLKVFEGRPKRYKRKKKL